MTHAIAISCMYDESDDVTNEHNVAEIFDCEASRMENVCENDDDSDIHVVGLPDRDSDEAGSFASPVPPSFSNISGN